MAKGSCELLDLLKEKEKGLNFIEMIPIFKDIIIGISFIHSNYLTHGDIKPANILISSGRYYLCDYGTGTNLYYESR